MKRILLGMVGVDSGQLMVCDPCYIDSQWKKEELEFFPDSSFKPAKSNFSYPAVCNRTSGRGSMQENEGQLNYEMGHPGVAVAFPSGYGDGSYPVYGTFNDEGRCVKVEIDCDLTQVQEQFMEEQGLKIKRTIKKDEQPRKSKAKSGKGQSKPGNNVKHNKEKK